MDQQTLWIVAALGVGTLFGVFWRMRGGFGPMNLRAVGIVLVAALASVLAIGKAETITAAMGILGAIAGYLFGAKPNKSEEEAASAGGGVDAKRATFGNNAKVAGRDINDTVNNIAKMLGDVQDMANATIQNLELITKATRPGLRRRRQSSFRWIAQDGSLRRRLQELPVKKDLDWTQEWIDLCLNDPSCLAEIDDFVRRWAAAGWTAAEASFDNTGEGLDVAITFEREIMIPSLK
jgi:hypothetical protein